MYQKLNGAQNCNITIYYILTIGTFVAKMNTSNDYEVFSWLRVSGAVVFRPIGKNSFINKVDDPT